MNDQRLVLSTPCPTSDSIINKKFAGWDGVIVLKAAERDLEPTVMTDVPEYQKTEDCTWRFGVYWMSQVPVQA